MCRVDHVFFTCGHVKDLSVDCEVAQVHGPLFNRLACPNYTIHSRHGDTQCGAMGGFYCGKTQNGTLIDKCRAEFSASQTQLQAQRSEHDRLVAIARNYRSEARNTGVPLEGLASNPAFRDVEQQRAGLLADGNRIRNKCTNLQNLISFAFKNRALLRSGVDHQLLWDGSDFNFERTIFPPQLLDPFRRHVPAPLGPITTSIEDQIVQRDYIPQITAPIANTHMGPVTPSGREALEQSTSLVAPKTHASKTHAPKFHALETQDNPTEQSEESWKLITRGNTPEGEDGLAKARRYAAQMAHKYQAKVDGGMERAGYDIANNGIRPPSKIGYRRPPNPQPTPSKNVESPAKKPKSTPAKVRRSARTRKSVPRYADSEAGSDLGFGSADTPPDKSDGVWNDSPARSDGSSSSFSPTMNSRQHTRQAVQASTGSPIGTSARGQTSLSAKILDYQKRTGTSSPSFPTQAQSSMPMNDPFRATPVSASYTAGQVLPSNSPNVPKNTWSSVGSVQAPSTPHTSLQSAGSRFDSQYRAAAMQRSNQLLQQLGHSLHQQQLESGIVGASSAMTAGPPHARQAVMTPTMGIAAPTMQSTDQYASSPFMRVPSTEPSYATTPASPLNAIQHNYQQARAANAMYPGMPGDRSFSTSSLPNPGLLNQQGQDGSLPSLTAGFRPSIPPRPNYERMRRSFSSAADLTPKSAGISDQVMPNTDPVKRSVPSMGPMVAPRKRIRLSLPGEDEAPILTPSRSGFQMHAPAGLPADDTLDYDAGLQAIETWEARHQGAVNNLAGLPSAPPAVSQDDAAQTLSNMSTRLSTATQEYVPSYEATETLATMHTANNNPVNTADQSLDTADSGHQRHVEAAIAGSDNLEDAADWPSEPDWGLLDDSVFES